MSVAAVMRGQAQQVRRLVPARAVPWLVRRRVERLWADPAYRAAIERQMRVLLERTERAPEIPDLARRYAEHSMARRYLRWHPRALTRQRVQGVEWLTTRRDPARGTVLNFLHHHHYEGMFASLARVGVDMDILALADALAPGVPAELRQHMRLIGSGGHLIPTTEGSAAVKERLLQGRIVAIASDVPSRTVVEFLGRRVLGSSGAARLAVATESPAVVVTPVREAGGGHYLQVHPPLEPSDFATPEELLAAMLRMHEVAVLAWPEALENPVSRWGQLDEAPAGS